MKKKITQKTKWSSTTGGKMKFVKYENNFPKTILACPHCGKPIEIEQVFDKYINL